MFFGYIFRRPHFTTVLFISLGKENYNLSNDVPCDSILNTLEVMKEKQKRPSTTAVCP